MNNLIIKNIIKFVLLEILYNKRIIKIVIDTVSIASNETIYLTSSKFPDLHAKCNIVQKIILNGNIINDFTIKIL